MSNEGTKPTEAQLEALMAHFYARVRQDEVLGPIFNAAVGDWPHHLKHIQSFWAAIVLGQPGFEGNPMIAHRKHLDVMRPEHFTRWLTLWGESTAALLPPEAAEMMQQRAAAMAVQLKRGLWGHPKLLSEQP